MPRATLAVSALMLVLCFAGRSDAKRTGAGNLYRQGKALHAAGAYRRAIEAFKKSYALHQHKNVLYSIGEAYRKLGQYRLSHEYYSRYAAQLEGSARATFDKKLLRLRSEQSCDLRIRTKPPGAEVTVDGKPLGATAAQNPVQIKIAGGTHRVTARADGYQPATQTVVAEFGEPINLLLTLTAHRQKGPDKHPAQTPSANKGVFVGVLFGPAFTDYLDDDLDVDAAVAISLEAGYLWRHARWGVHLHGSLSFTPVEDAVIDDGALFVTVAAGAGGLLYLLPTLALEARFALGVTTLGGAASDSFLIRQPAGGSETLVGLSLLPSLGVRWTLWRDLSVTLVPLALSYSPRVGGFADLAPSIGGVLRFRILAGLAWQL